MDGRAFRNNIGASPAFRAKPARLQSANYRVESESRLATCNNGWMSRIENATKELLIPVVEGQATNLDRDAQRRVATWAVKTAMLVEHTLPPEFYWTDDERKSFSVEPHPIPGDEPVVRIAAYDGTGLMFAKAGRLT